MRKFPPIALALVALALSTTACSGPTSTTTTTRDIPGPATRLEITSSGGDITLVPTTGAMRVTETATYTGKAPHATLDVHDGVVALATAGCGGHHGACGITYRVEIPAGLTIRLASDGGAVHVRGTVAGLDIRSAGGDVAVRLDTAPASLAVDSGGGRTTLHLPPGSYPSPSVSIRTGGGDLDVES
ncbi:hypothetical protein [Micromonospora eburnea]|uniref:Adhesin n=1 Tax=Micromonospora eburnea TaxID=227316 RepID=A0A1C6V2Y8_9ACTN|nr:hypothetical protein [Micromonospora eburnea]SCL60280.1 Domain of unknown function [Micromonospora eburnea]